MLPPCALAADASSTFSSPALLPDGVLEVIDRCSHDAPYFSDPRVLSSQEVWQSYVPTAPPSVTSSSSSAATTTEGEGTSGEWLPLRFVVSTLDLTEPGHFCQAVGQEVPDFLLSFPANSSSSSNGDSDDHVVHCSAEDSLLTDEKRNVLVAHVLPRALLWLSQRIAVMSVQGNLSVLQQGSCGAYTMPSSSQASGVPDADVLVLVSAVPPPASGSEEWVRGAICQFDQYGRPTVLVLNVAPEVISVVAVDSDEGEGVSPSSAAAAAASASSSSGAFCSPELGTYSDVALYSLSRSVSHALVHGLGFSYSYLTSRLSQNVSMAVSERRGKAVRLVTSTLASRAATTHFGSCVEEEDNHSTTIVPWVAGVELEDQGMAVNHNGTYSSSHWEARNHGHDLMSAQSTIWVVRNATVASRCLTEPAAVYRSRRFTNVTLSFLEDFGFYRRMNQSLVEDTLFGKGLGCAFLSETCNLTRSNALWSSTYCKERGGGGEEEMSMLGRWCASDRRAVANCPTTQYAEPVPWPFRYFVEDATQGGLWDLADYCPLPSPVHWCSSDHDATTTSTLTELSQLLSISGVPDSRCLTFLDLAVIPTTGGGSPLWDGAVCANLRCVRDDPTAVDLRVQLQLRTSSGGNEWSTCDDAGSTTSSSSSSQTFVTVRWNETATVMVACPSVWEVCDSVSVVVLETTTTTTSTTATETTTTSSTTDGSITSTTDQPSMTSTTTGTSTTTMAPNDTNSTTTIPPNETFAPATTTTTSVPFTTSAPQDNSGGRGQRPLRPEAACNHTCVVLIAVIGGLLVFAILVYMVVQCGKAKRSPPPPPPPHPTPPRAGPPFFRPIIMYEPTPDFEMMTFNEYQQHRHNGHQQNQPQQEEEVYQERRTESRSPQQPGGRQGLQQYDSQTRFNAPSAARWAGGGGGTTPHGNSYDRHL